MKKLKMTLSVIFLAVGLTLLSCGETSNGKSDLKGKEYTSEYVCPMHCEGSGSEETGKCPVCGMDYVLNSDHQKDSHQH